MTEYTRKKATQLRIPTVSTPEELGRDRFAFQSKMVTFGDYTLVASYIHKGNGKAGYFCAAYLFLREKETSSDDEIRLQAVSSDFYEDDGHALKAAFEWASQWA